MVVILTRATSFAGILHVRPNTTQRVVALTVAGSDSGGGAGVQADLKTFHTFGVFGASALTAVTAQNTLGVQSVLILPPSIIRRQIESVRQDLRPAAAKTGMLGNADGVGAAAAALSELAPAPLVVDPVMVATSGDRLLDPTAVAVLVSELVPLATLVTPNVPEAEILARHAISGEVQMAEAARRIVDAGAGAALIKGGHLADDEVLDLYWDGEVERVWKAPRIDTSDTHGTGCTLSAAITAGLALGLPLLEAVDTGLAFTRAAIASAPGLGSGHGPLDHWVDPQLDR